MRIAFYLTLLFLSIYTPLSSQICDGNLGENIFTEGDFGSGTANVVSVNPFIAPGYNYTSSPPPMDGSYTISNNIASWPFAFGWAEIQDNSTDPNGYMMIVNASFEPGLFYEQVVDGLCENTLYVFSADIFNLIRTGDNLIRPNVSFLIDGINVYSTGLIPENEIWNTYGFTFTTGPGQSSVTLSLQNNAPGGIGNDLAIDNITFRPCGPEALILPLEIANICEDGSPIDLVATIIGEQYDTPYFQWQTSFDEGLTWVDIAGETNNTYTHSILSGGFYYYRYLLANDPGNLLNAKCRVISNVKIVQVVPKFYTIVDTLCEGLSFSLGTNQYNNTGVYVDSLISVLGCDSIVTLDLTIVPDEGITAIFHLEDPSCPGLEDGRIIINAITKGTAPYTVYIDNEWPENAIDNANLGAGDYLYTISDKYGCQFETTISLQNPIPIQLDIGLDWAIDLGEFVLINPTTSVPIETYFWEPSELINCDPFCESLDWAPPFSTTVKLTATSSSGCIASDSVNVEVTNVRKVYIPNAFSPNGDGVNDSFIIYGAVPNIQQIEQLLIFNRWGAVVFSNNNFAPNDRNAGWNGMIEGKIASSGIYTYLVKVRFLDGEVIPYSGDVSLIK